MKNTTTTTTTKTATKTTTKNQNSRIHSFLDFFHCSLPLLSLGQSLSFCLLINLFHFLSFFLSMCVSPISLSLCPCYQSAPFHLMNLFSLTLSVYLLFCFISLDISIPLSLSDSPISFSLSLSLSDSPISFSLEPSFCLSLCLLSSFSLKASLVFACFFQAVHCLMHLSCFFLSTSDSPNLSLYRAVHSYFCDLSISLSFSLSLL